jgi:acetyltransferase-like isoleucine patch superfamily enzyme/dTDP-4-dehydrorhamnose 3,5-epimerase-like enzyme
MEEQGIRLHASSLVEAKEIGAGTSVGAFARILAGARIGSHCRIGDHASILGGAVLGNGVTIETGCVVTGGVVVEDGAVLGPQAVILSHDDAEAGARGETTRIGQCAQIGANATIHPGVSVGPRAIVAAGSVVTRNVPSDAVVAGNPARITGYAGLTPQRPPAPVAAPPDQPGAVATRVRGVTFHFLPLVEDLRGNLAIGETGKQVPFEIRRFFLVFEVEDQRIRGEHAHRQLHQFLVCVHGSCHFVADDGENREEFILDRPNFGLYIPPLVWGVQYKYTPDAVLLVLASDHYDPADYIRDYTEFLSLAGRRAS